MTDTTDADLRDTIATTIETLRPASYTQELWAHGYRKAVADAAEIARGDTDD